MKSDSNVEPSALPADARQMAAMIRAFVECWPDPDEVPDGLLDAADLLESQAHRLEECEKLIAPGTLGRLAQWVYEYAEKEFGRSPYQSNPPTDEIIKGVAALRQRIEECEKALRAIKELADRWPDDPAYWLLHDILTLVDAALATQQKTEQAESTNPTTNAS